MAELLANDGGEVGDLLAQLLDFGPEDGVLAIDALQVALDAGDGIAAGLLVGLGGLGGGVGFALARFGHGGFDGLEELGLVEGLGEELEVGEEFGGFGDDVFFATGHHDDGDALQVWVGLHFVDHLPTVHVGHEAVHDDEGGMLFLDHGQAFCAVLGFQDLDVACRRQHFSDLHPNQSAVINNQNLLSAHKPFLCCGWV